MAWRIAASLLLITLSSLTSAQEPTPQRVVGAQRMADLIMRKVEPVYPPLARAARIQGTVTLRVEINKSGDVENMQVISGHPMLAPAAIDAVRQWKYQPYLLNGEPVEVETRVTVNFTLAGTAPAEGVVGSAPGGIPSGEKGGILSNVPVDTYPTVPGRVRVSQGVMAQLTITRGRSADKDRRLQRRRQTSVAAGAEHEGSGGTHTPACRELKQHLRHTDSSRDATRGPTQVDRSPKYATSGPTGNRSPVCEIRGHQPPASPGPGGGARCEPAERGAPTRTRGRPEAGAPGGADRRRAPARQQADRGAALGDGDHRAQAFGDRSRPPQGHLAATGSQPGRPSRLLRRQFGFQVRAGIRSALSCAGVHRRPPHPPEPRQQ